MDVLATFQSNASNSEEGQEAGSGSSSALSFSSALNAFHSPDKPKSDGGAGSGPSSHPLTSRVAVADILHSDVSKLEDETGSVADAFGSPFLTPCSSYSYDPADFPRECEIEEFMSPSFQWPDSTSASFVSRSWSTTSRDSVLPTPKVESAWWKPKFIPKAPPVKASQMNLLPGRAGNVGLGKTAEVLDTLSSNMTNKNPRSWLKFGVTSLLQKKLGVTSQGNKRTVLGILAFEVANTITRGASLMQSVSREGIQFLKKEIMASEGVQSLVSTDYEELLGIVANDVRSEFRIFLSEVARFGTLSKDRQWHHVFTYFDNRSCSLILQKDVETTLQQLMKLAQNTLELYHALQTLKNIEETYYVLQMHADEDVWTPDYSEGLANLMSQLKMQRNVVKKLQKNSLWSNNVEQVMEKLFDIVVYLQDAIFNEFRNYEGSKMVSWQNHCPCTLGISGLSLYYAKLIYHIDNIVSGAFSPPCARDTLYRGLPQGIKYQLRFYHVSKSFLAEKLSTTEIIAELQRILRPILPVAESTLRAHYDFGWVSEWANMGIVFDRKPVLRHNVIKIQTLYHANKDKTEKVISDLLFWLRTLIETNEFEIPPLFKNPTELGSGLEFCWEKSKDLDLVDGLQNLDLSPLDSRTRRNTVPSR